MWECVKAILAMIITMSTVSNTSKWQTPSCNKVPPENTYWTITEQKDNGKTTERQRKDNGKTPEMEYKNNTKWFMKRKCFLVDSKPE